MDAPYHPHDIEQELSDCCLDCECSLASVKRHILAFHDRMAGSSPNSDDVLTSDEVHRLFAELDDVVRLPGSEQLVSALLADAEVRAILPDLRVAYSSFFQLDEREFAERLLGVDDPWTELRGFVFYPNYVSLTDAEVALAGLHRGDRVVFLGSGPLPLTNILLAADHGLATVAVEEDPELASLAERVVERLGLRESVRIVHGTHDWLSPDEVFSLVMVAAQASPRQQVLEHLACVLPAGSRISLRVYEKGLRRILAGDEGLRIPAALLLVDTVDPGPSVNNTVALLEVAAMLT